MKILCVAEKPSIAKEVARILSGGRNTVRKGPSKYNLNFDFDFDFAQYGRCQVTMTLVLGHLMGIEYPANGYKWGQCSAGKLLDAPLVDYVVQKDVSANIAAEARNLDFLFIWTDCDREGEYIGYEILQCAQKGNPRLDLAHVWRSKFSHLERSHVVRAAHNPILLDMRSVKAVGCRIAIDFKVGTSFTRLFTDLMKLLHLVGPKDVVSYGTCQFPTLGFIVDRYKRVKNFVPEAFWYITLDVKKNTKVLFTWTRDHFFDRMFVFMLYQQCLLHETARVTKLETRRTSNYKPLPLTTVELQKECSRVFKMTAKRALDAAEKLYNKGYISYPRTETNKFPPTMDFLGIIAKHVNDSRWGTYAASLQGEGFSAPRAGNNDDKAHPAIHPVNYVSLDVLETADQKKVYEYVVRRFLACCSKDAVGLQTSVTLKWGEEFFTTSGLIVLERNYLDVFIYRKWESSKELPNFVEGEEIKVASGLMKEGKTSPPKHMTETELIALMDANGIGTDATIADHIEKVTLRNYIVKQKQALVEYLLPTPLGMGLIEGLDQLDFNLSLSKPFLRRQLDSRLEDIISGRAQEDVVLNEVIGLYKHAFLIAARELSTIRQVCVRLMRENS